MTRNYGSAVLCAAMLLSCESTPVTPEDVVVTTLTLNQPVVEIALGGSFTLKAFPHNSAGNLLPGADVVWSVSNPAVASVDSRGLVRALGQGTSQVFARAGDVETTAGVRVSASGTYPQSAIINATFGTIGVCAAGRYPARTLPVTEPGGFIWTSSNPRIATVDSMGLITGLRVGTVTVTGAWAPDTTIRTSRTAIVTDILLPKIGFQGLRAAGSETPMSFTEVRGVVHVTSSVWFTGPDTGELQFLIDSTVFHSLPYPGGCPYRPSTTGQFLATFDSALFAPGPHELRGWVLTPTGEKLYTWSQAIVIVR